MSLSKKNIFKVYEDDTVDVDVELHPYYKALIHVKSKVWNKSVFKHYREVFDEILLALEDKLEIDCIYAAILLDDKKLKKFASMFGFEDTGVTVKTIEGNTRGVYKCLI